MMNFKKWIGKKKAKKLIISEGSLIIPDREKNLFEKTLKFYVFVHQLPHKSLTPELSEQLKFCGNAVYSLIKNWLADGKPSLEYMDFLNQKIEDLRTLPENILTELRILPHEINELELSETARFTFTDAEDDDELSLTYKSESGACLFSISKYI